MHRYIVDSLWMIPATASAYFVKLMLFGFDEGDWRLILITHGIGTWIAIRIGPPCYRRWFERGS